LHKGPISDARQSTGAFRISDSAKLLLPKNHLAQTIGHPVTNLIKDSPILPVLELANMLHYQGCKAEIGKRGLMN